MDQQVDALNQRLDKLTAFLQKHMVTTEELQDLRADLPTKADFNQLQTSVDGIAKGFKTTEQELQVIGARASRMEAWIQRAANKIGVEYKP